VHGVEVVVSRVGVRGGTFGERAEHVLGHLLHENGGRRRDAVRAVAEDSLHPAHRAGVEDAGAARSRVVGRVAEAAGALADQRRVRKDLDRAWHRVGRVDPVVFHANEVAEAGARRHPGPAEHPAVRGHHPVRSDRGIALVEGAG
jgi:hypothetical protein